MASVKVFGSPTAAEVARVLACLFEKEVEFQLIRFDTYKGQKRLPEYLKLQPKGEALTFEDGTTTIIDSRKACRHVADVYKEHGNKELLGTGALERASIEQWLQIETYQFDPPSSDLLFSLAYPYPPGTEKDEEWVRKSKPKKDLDSVLDIYEQRLKESAYLAGDKFTLADLSHLPNLQRLADDNRCRSLFANRTSVEKWWKEISSRPSWRSVVSLQQSPPPSV